jgi:hypothetical protein
MFLNSKLKENYFAFMCAGAPLRSSEYAEALAAIETGKRV